MTAKKSITAVFSLLTLLSACTPNLETRLANLEGNQKQIVGALNLIASCKADKDPKLPVTTVPCPLQAQPVAGATK